MKSDRAALLAATRAAVTAARLARATDPDTKSARVEARRAARAALDGQLTPERLAVDRAVRRALRAEIHRPMNGFEEPGEGEVEPAPTGAVALESGQLVTRSPAVGGVVADPEIVVRPGFTYSATAVVEGERGFLGLQWISEDGQPMNALWGRGPGPVTVTGVAPQSSAGARMILAVLTSAAGMAGKGVDARATMALLRNYVRDVLNG